jgi:carbon starvation protein
MDPLGGINSLWPLYGIANQLLAAVALCVATSILIKMNKARYAWITILPMAWLVVVTQTGAYQKLFHPNPRIGFMADAQRLTEMMNAGKVAPEMLASVERLIFNDRLDAVVTAFLAFLTLVILADSAREWIGILRGRKKPWLHEAQYVVSALPME